MNYESAIAGAEREEQHENADPAAKIKEDANRIVKLMGGYAEMAFNGVRCFKPDYSGSNFEYLIRRRIKFEDPDFGLKLEKYWREYENSDWPKDFCEWQRIWVRLRIGHKCSSGIITEEQMSEQIRVEDETDTLMDEVRAETDNPAEQFKLFKKRRHRINKASEDIKQATQPEGPDVRHADGPENSPNDSERLDGPPEASGEMIDPPELPDLDS